MPLKKPSETYSGDCDCCQSKNNEELFRCIAYGIETFICVDCTENDDHTNRKC